MPQDDLSGVSCLVLGGGGFIGTNLCRALRTRGAGVRAFGRNRSFPEALEGVEWISGSFSDRQALAQAMDGVEILYHLIAGSIPESSNGDPAADLAASTLKTLTLLELCRSSTIRKIVFVSSGGTVYGIPESVPIPESAATNPISAYGISRLATEKYLHLYQYLYGIDYTVLRVANPYGPFQSPHRQQGVIGVLAFRALNGLPLDIWGTGEVVRDFVHVDDVVEAMLAVLGYRGPQRVFNVGSGTGRSINQIIADLESVLDRGPLLRAYKPGRPVDVPVNVLDIGLIRRELGWIPRTEWLSGLCSTLFWIESVPY